MENQQAGHTTTHIPGDDSTHEPAEHGGKSPKTLDSPLAEEDVHTQEQRNQDWTPGPGRQGDDPMRIEGTTAPPLDRPSGLVDKLEEVKANPHSDAQSANDTQGNPNPEEKLAGGQPKTGSGEQDPMRQAGGGQSGG